MRTLLLYSFFSFLCKESSPECLYVHVYPACKSSNGFEQCIRLVLPLRYNKCTYTICYVSWILVVSRGRIFPPRFSLPSPRGNNRCISMAQTRWFSPIGDANAKSDASPSLILAMYNTYIDTWTTKCKRKTASFFETGEILTKLSQRVIYKDNETSYLLLTCVMCTRVKITLEFPRVSLAHAHVVYRRIRCHWHHCDSGAMVM